jgi:hypothetical protein
MPAINADSTVTSGAGSQVCDATSTACRRAPWEGLSESIIQISRLLSEFLDLFDKRCRISSTSPGVLPHKLTQRLRVSSLELLGHGLSCFGLPVL